MVRMGTWAAAEGLVVVVEVVEVEVVERRLTFRLGRESNQLENHSAKESHLRLAGLFSWVQKA